MSTRVAGARRRQLVREVVLIVAAIVLYFVVRGLIATRVELAYRNAQRVVDLEQSVGVFTEKEL